MARRQLKVLVSDCYKGRCDFDTENENLVPTPFKNQGFTVIFGAELKYDFSKLHCADGFKECVNSCCYMGKCRGLEETCLEKGSETDFLNLLLYLVGLSFVIVYIGVIFVMRYLYRADYVEEKLPDRSEMMERPPNDLNLEHKQTVENPKIFEGEAKNDKIEDVKF